MMSDLEVNLPPEAKEVFNADSAPPPPLLPQSIDSPKNDVAEWPPAPPPLVPHFRTLNSTFFVKQQVSEEDNDSEITTDTPTAIMFETEQRLRDSVKAIQFKEILLRRDKHSREVILQRCIEWLQMPTTRGNSKTLDWFMALSLLKTKDLLENSYLWHTLHESIYASDSFKTVISLFDTLT
jgi:hypothetical protein